MHPPKDNDHPPPKKHKKSTLAFLPLFILVLQGCAPLNGCSLAVKEGQMVPHYDVEIVCRLPDCTNWRPKRVMRALDSWLIIIGDTMDLEPGLPAKIIVEDLDDLGASGPFQRTSGKSLDAYTIQIAGRAYYGKHILAMGNSAFSHELAHILFWRSAVFNYDPDYNHAEPGGPWTDDTDKMLKEYDEGLLAMFPPEEVPGDPPTDMSLGEP
jgi:hypothetical protein